MSAAAALREIDAVRKQLLPLLVLGPVLGPWPVSGGPDVDGAERCRVCGCTDRNGCVPACHWIFDPQREGFRLCSNCTGQ